MKEVTGTQVENPDYRDKGCEVSPRCLDCPLPRCRYDESGGAHQILLPGRNAEMLDLFEREGLTVDELANGFGLSRRAVFSALRQARDAR